MSVWVPATKGRFESGIPLRKLVTELQCLLNGVYVEEEPQAHTSPQPPACYEEAYLLREKRQEVGSEKGLGARWVDAADRSLRRA